MQTIALIMTDDTGVGVLAEPEEPDDRYDDLTLIGPFLFPISIYLMARANAEIWLLSLSTLRRF